MRRSRTRQFAIAVCTALTLFFILAPDAWAIPSFARKYKTGCTTCHTVYPMLNPFGEAFRRNGFRFPSANGSVDSDNVKAEVLALGREEETKVFPKAVWPSSITQAVPLSVAVEGGLAYVFPSSDAYADKGHTFTWDGIVDELSLFAGGAFNDTLTYFAQASASADGVDLEHAFLLWGDIVGPRHLVNLWIGRLLAPSLTSFGTHSSYFVDRLMPSTSIAGLYNPTGQLAPGASRADGAEINGVVAHRIDYSLGWLASRAAPGISVPTAEDVYAHLGFKIGGMTLDGEGPDGAIPNDPMRPWEETALTIDAFGYHGLSLLDNGTGLGAPPAPVRQNDSLNAIGGVGRLQLGSLKVTAGAQFERHSRPYPGTPAAPPAPGTPDLTEGNGFTQYDEIDYVIFPWLVPGVRADLTWVTRSGSRIGHIVRVMPGVAMLVRQNIKVVLSGDFEQAYGLPPAGSWGAAGASITPPLDGASKVQVEQVDLHAAWAF